MSKRTIIVCGHGPGISDAVARKFGGEGFSVALVARNSERIASAASALKSAGIDAKSFPCNLGDPDAVTAMVGQVQSALGEVDAVHWNAYLGAAGDLLTAPVRDLHATFDVAVTGMIAALQAAHADLKARKGALLVTGGGLAFHDPKVNAMAVDWNAMGLAVAKAAQHKAVNMLHEKLKKESIYVGEVVVLGLVKGTAFDQGNATLDPKEIAAKFWSLYQERTTATVNFG